MYVALVRCGFVPASRRHVFERIKGYVSPTMPFANVAALIDKIYGDLEATVPPHSYGRYWLLQIKGSGAQLREMGSLWAEETGIAIEPVQARPVDKRALTTVGIKPGQTLIVKRLIEGRKV